MGTTRGIALGVSALLILGLTFTLGAIAGRHWGRHAQPSVVAERRVSPAPRRSGLTEMASEQPPIAQEKLTFYKTLTAPLESAQVSIKTDAPTHPAAAPKPQVAPAKVGAPASERVVPKAEEGPQTASTAWTVQVGVFSSPQQAAGVKRGLDQKGFAAEVAPTSSGDGQVRYRVRVGTFHSREEALREAERMRSQRSLPTYVTAK